MTKQTIEVEVPDGMEIDKTTSHIAGDSIYMIRLQKIKPRRIVLEEISREEYYRLFNSDSGSGIYCIAGSYWNGVKESELSLTNEEPKS